MKRRQRKIGGNRFSSVFLFAKIQKKPGCVNSWTPFDEKPCGLIQVCRFSQFFLL